MAEHDRGLVLHSHITVIGSLSAFNRVFSFHIRAASRFKVDTVESQTSSTNFIELPGKRKNYFHVTYVRLKVRRKTTNHIHICRYN